MPLAYARAFSPSEIAEHVQIAARRGSQLAHGEVWKSKSGPRVCVVAEDRPGLLALVTDALLVHGLSIRSALVYCRERADGQSEAVDFFELRQANSTELGFEIEASELGALLQTLNELVAEDIQAAARVSTPSIPVRNPTRVYFDLEGLRRGQAVLLLEAPDSDGLLNAVTNALHGQGARILASEIRTEGNTARDRFDLTSRDGKPLTAIRLCDIQQAVLAALPAPASRR